MKEVIEILKKRLLEMQAAQSSPSLTTYCNSLRLAIRILEDYDVKFEKLLEKELLKP